MNSNEIRQQFLDFFRGKGHAIVPSSPVVPHDDPTLMFTNAGMNQFKDVFLGAGSRSYVRAADTQKCIRAGGKHNDLDDVGQDTYHHTFFEMLGNWSFGDYFKKEAIEWAWELLTKVWGIDKSRLHATYFQGDPAEGLEPDTEAAQLWRNVTDINPAHIHPGNKKDNFWEMGDTGPCGPCSEIHIDLTPDKSGRDLVNKGDARVMEIWNLVFIQYNRGADAKLTPLPAKHVDTGMGFERVTAVLQGKTSNYDTDVFTPIFAAIQKRTGASDYKGTLPSEPSRDIGEPSRAREEAVPGGDGEPSRDRKGAVNAEPPSGPLPHGRGSVQIADQIMIDVSYRVIADHLRCLTFALTDGAIPSNEGRGYVLRRILRRAVRYGRQYLNMHEPFLCDLVQPLVDHMGGAFPELRSAHGSKNPQHISNILRNEEGSFLRTLDRGLRIENAVAAACQAMVKPAAPLLSDSFLRGLIHKTFSESTSVQTFSWQGSQELSEPGDAFPETILTGQLATLVTDDVLHQIRANPGQIPGRVAFMLHDTFGFPIDLTQLIAGEQGLTVDTSEYDRLMEEARQRARAATKIVHPSIIDDFEGDRTEFVGYAQLEADDVIVEQCRSGEGYLSRRPLGAGDSGALILDATPFYAEQGGQVGDVGIIKSENGAWEFEVTDTQKVGGVYLHIGTCRKGAIPSEGPSADAHVDARNPIIPQATSDVRLKQARAVVRHDHRHPTTQNHTSTHLLNWALREVLGEHVQQKGSLVDPEKTRFDFSHLKPVEPIETERIESLVNQKIEERLAVYTKEVDQKKAREINTLRAVFGEKYPDLARVVSIGADIDAMLADPKNPRWMDYSVEFCGGTHLKNSAEAERFVLVGEEGVAKGIRRVVGVSGEAARRAEAEGQRLLAEADTLAKAGADAVADRLSAFQQTANDAIMPVRVRHALLERIAELQKLAKEHGKRAAAASGDAVKDRVAGLFAEASKVGNVTVVVGEVPEAPVDALRGAIDWVRNKTEASAVLLAMTAEGKVTLMAGMSKAVVDRGIKAGDLIKEIAPLVGGKGGGRPDMAQGGGTDPAGLPKALDAARAWLVSKLS